MHTINVEIKCKLSDLEIALKNPQNQLSVTRYIQSERQLTLVIYFVGSKQSGVLLTENCFGTTPIANGPEWILLILLKVCVLPNTQNLDSLIRPRSLDSNIESRCQCIMSHSLIRAPTYLL